jgi:hypothetical protein
MTTRDSVRGWVGGNAKGLGQHTGASWTDKAM